MWSWGFKVLFLTLVGVFVILYCECVGIVKILLIV